MIRILAGAAVVGLCMTAVQAADIDGDSLYNQYCAMCHTDPDDVRTPPLDALNDYNANSIVHSLIEGIMRAQAAALSEEQIIVLAEYLSDDRYDPTITQSLAACEREMPQFELSLDSNWNGWGGEPGNSRHQPASGTAIHARNLDQLELVWAFGHEGASTARAQPTVINGTMLMGSSTGMVHALDMATGCSYWSFPALTEVRASVPVAFSPALDRYLAVVADMNNRLYVLDARTGERLWFDDVDDNPYARSTGSPVVHDGMVFVPVSNREVFAAGSPDHHCCTFRGNVAAYDLNTGKKLWHTYIMEEAVEVGTNAIGNPIYAPSGAPIWQAPSIDPSRNTVYAGTGQNFTSPTSETSDAVIAFDMHNGDMKWVYQTTEDDAYTTACSSAGDHPNCPDPGPDLDIGAPILPVTLSDGTELVIAGTKGSEVFGLDPDGGSVVWHRRVGRGGALGGVHWGMTAIGDTVYVPVSDRVTGIDGTHEPMPGLHALDMRTGKSKWYVPAPERCQEGQRGCREAYSAPASSAADVVFAGSLNGHLFAHDAETGELIWEYDSNREYKTINQVEARGGSMDATGPVFSGDYMIVNTGYATFGQMGGNTMLVFRLNRQEN